MRKQRYAVRSGLRTRLSTNKYNLKWAKLSAASHPRPRFASYNTPAARGRFAGAITERPRSALRAQPLSGRAIGIERPGKENLMVARSDRPATRLTSPRSAGLLRSAPAGAAAAERRRRQPPQRAGSRGEGQTDKIAKLLQSNHVRLHTTRVQSEWNKQFHAKQSLKYFYGSIGDKTLMRMASSRQAKEIGITSLLEQRLDVLTYRLGMARSIFEARQLITHGHIHITQRRVAAERPWRAHDAERGPQSAGPRKAGSAARRCRNSGFIVPVGSVITCDSDLCYSNALSRVNPSTALRRVSRRASYGREAGCFASLPSYLVKINAREGVLVRTPNAQQVLRPKDFNANTAELVVMQAA